MKTVLSVFIALACLSLLLYGCDSKSTMTGRCLVATNGKYLIVADNSDPIVMSNQTNNTSLFESLHTGDKIRITHDDILLSYPGHTGVYSCKVLENGSIEDIPENTLASLTEMNWTFDLV